MNTQVISHQSSVIKKTEPEVYGYKTLVVWQKSMDVSVLIYAYTKKFPKEELYGLASQMKRAALSISSNIAEGSGRRTSKDFRHFLHMAYGSAMELETQLILARRMDFGTIADYEKISGLLDEVLKMLNKMVLKTDD